jgi:hypothetical protein
LDPQLVVEGVEIGVLVSDASGCGALMVFRG